MKQEQMPTTKYSAEILNAAIYGFEQQKIRIDSQIAELKEMLSARGEEESGVPSQSKSRKKFSAATKQRMREAQQRRRAESHPKGQAPPASANKSRAKRKLSAAGRAAIVDALKKRWATKKADAGKSAVRKAGTKKAAQ